MWVGDSRGGYDMGDSTKNKLMTSLGHETVLALNRYYYGKHSYCPSVRCGSKWLDRYEPTSTVNGCSAIAHGSVLRVRSLFIHHVFREGLAPKSMRAQLTEPPSCTFVEEKQRWHSADIAVGIPFLKWVLKSDDITAKGNPETQRSSKYICKERGKVGWLTSAIFFASSLIGSNAAFRRYSYDDNISAFSIFRSFEQTVVGRIEEKIGQDPAIEARKHNAIVITDEDEFVSDGEYCAD